jgi:hypothetical protein
MTSPARITAKTKREAIAESFGDIPVDSDQVNFLYSRRNLTIVRDPDLGGRERHTSSSILNWNRPSGKRSIKFASATAPRFSKRSPIG